MTTASWCVLVALVVCHAGCAIARMRSSMPGVLHGDRGPCVASEAVPGHPPRAWDPRRNAFQALSLFAAAVIAAQQAGAPQAWVDGLALAWMGVRIAHMGFHLAGRPSLRRLAQLASVGCALGIFAGSAMAGRPHAPSATGSRIVRSAAGLRD